MDGSYIDSHLTQQIEDEIVNNPGRVPADHQPANQVIPVTATDEDDEDNEGLRNYYANLPGCQRAYNDFMRARIQANHDEIQDGIYVLNNPGPIPENHQQANQVILQV